MIRFFFATIVASIFLMGCNTFQNIGNNQKAIHLEIQRLHAKVDKMRAERTPKEEVGVCSAIFLNGQFRVPNMTRKECRVFRDALKLVENKIKEKKGDKKSGGSSFRGIPETIIPLPKEANTRDVNFVK